MRTSSYVIYVDLPDDRDSMLLVHGYTGAYDRVSQRVATFVRANESGRPPAPLYGFWRPEPRPEGDVSAPEPETLATLRRRGYLTDLSVEEERALVASLANAAHEKQLQAPPSYIIMPTYDCNLRCAYCFQDHMRTNPQNHHLLKGMSREMADRILLGMQNLETQHGRRSSAGPRRVGFFGGEPLLRRNRPLIEYFDRRLRELGPLNLWAVTNATELDAYEDLLGPSGISRLQITLDGTPEEHDKRRIYADGSGSFEAIANNITMALRRKVNVSIRLNVDRNNIEKLPELTRLFDEKGWVRESTFSAYAAPVHAANPNIQRKTTFNSWELDKEIEQLKRDCSSMAIISGPDERLRRSASRVFAQTAGHTMPRKESFCGAHTSMYIFDSFGDMYACWERTGDKSIRIGHVNESGTIELEGVYRDLWRSRTIATNDICNRCRYAFHCGGGCAVLAEARTGQLHTNHCDAFAARFRSSVAAAYLAHEAGAGAVDDVEPICDQ